MDTGIKKIKKIFALFSSVFGEYKPHILAITVIGFISGILEGIGANALIPLFSFVTGDGTGGDDFISRMIENLFAYAHVDFTLKYLLVFIAILFVFKAAILYLGAYIQIKIAADYEKNKRIALFKETLDARWPYLLHQKIGHLEKVLSWDVKMTTALLNSTSMIIIASSGLLMYVLIAVNISFSVSIMVLVFGTLFLFLVRPLFRIAKRISAETTRLFKDTAHFLNQNILGMKTLKASSVGENILHAAESRFIRLRTLRVKSALLASIPNAVFQPVSIIFILVIFALAYKTPNFNIAAFAAIIYLVQRMFTHIQQVATQIGKIYAEIPYVEDMVRYEKKTAKQREENVGEAPFRFKGTFAFRDVSFSYNKSEEILSGISFDIPHNAFVGLIGPSGAGKTTVVDIILRLFNPTKGAILVDGVNAQDIDMKEWRKHIGYVSQDIFVMNDTLENNIRFYDPGITGEDIIRAAKDAYINSFIETLPRGYQTVVGERGILLSAGQRQRVIIARALARRPEFLVLDEATSALDNESEKYIQDAIENLKGKTTVLVIAHRLSTVLDCDSLIILDGGKIIEQGNPRELLKDKKSYFSKAYNIRR